MRYDKLFDTLQNLIDQRLTQTEIATALGMTVQTMGQRKNRNSDFSTDELEKLENHFGVALIDKNKNSVVKVDYYPEIFASCGSGQLVFSDVKSEISVEKNLIKGYSKANSYSIITAKGDSMSGVIENNDKLLIQHYNGEQIIDNAIYVFAYNNDIYVKHLAKNIDEIIVKSANPNYSTKIIKDLDNIQIIGKVVSILRDLE